MAAAGLGSLAALEGRWSLSRRIVHADGSENTLEGVTTFRRTGEGLIQDEEGELAGPGLPRPVKAVRRYLWRQDGDRLECLFENGRPFHAVPSGSACPEAVHLCDPDRYEVAYDFTDFPLWHSVWRVVGPRKDYVMTSCYRPMSQ